MRSYRCAKILVETTENISIHDRIIVFFSFLKYKIQGKKRENEKEKKKTKVEHRRSLTLRSFLKQIKDVLGSDSNIERNSTEIYF